MLSDKQKLICIDVCTYLLCGLQAQPQTFFDRIIKHDESWVHHFDPETKWQSMVSRNVSSLTSKKFKVTQSAG